MSTSLGVAVVSTFPPRACGLATFAHDLIVGVGRQPAAPRITVAAIESREEHLPYAPSVQLTIDEGDVASYVAAARHLTPANGVDVVSIQHDFGRFGIWRDGFTADYLVPLLAALVVPAVITLHSVPRQPNRLMQRTVQDAARLASAVVVMAEAAKGLLREAYGLDEAALAKVRYLPHGVPDHCPIGPAAAADAKRALGLRDGPVLSTFGLLGEGKGIEYAIDALPPLVARYPGLRYLVVGRTHPEVLRQQGEAYREALQVRVRKLGLEGHVQFVNQYLTEDGILCYLAATDIYVTPYLAPDQITSGALAFALGCGKAIVATPYRYAQEVLAGGRGILAAFRDAASITQAVDEILSQPALRAGLEQRAAALGRTMRWSEVAARYLTLFAAVARPRLRLAAPEVSAAFQPARGRANPLATSR